MEAVKDLLRRVRSTKTATKVWGSVASVVGALVLFSAYAGVVDSWNLVYQSASGITLTGWLLAFTIILLLMLIAAVWALVITDRSLKHTIAETLESRHSDQRERFEAIEKDTIKLGWVSYYPTLIESPTFPEPIGVGPGVLRRVFRNKVVFAEEQSGWDTVIQELRDGLFDVIATPLYDIRERKAFVDFTIPIFYADIGLFTAADNAEVIEAVGAQGLISFPEAVQKLSKLDGQLRFCGHKGELQHKMKEKYFPKSAMVETTKERFSVRSALVALCGSRRSRNFSDLYFCERVIAERLKPVSEGSIINLIRPGQLMFPVGFAVRKGDETLRKYINLRLMEIDADNSSGVMDEIIKHTENILSDVLPERRGDFFLRKRVGLEPEPTELLGEEETSTVISIKSEPRGNR